MDDLRIYDRMLTDLEVEDLTVRLPARALLMSLNGRPDAEIATLQPDEGRGCPDRRGSQAAKTKDEIEKAQEKDHQAKAERVLPELRRAGEGAPALRETGTAAKRKRPSWKAPSPRSWSWPR